MEIETANQNLKITLISSIPKRFQSISYFKFEFENQKILFSDWRRRVWKFHENPALVLLTETKYETINVDLLTDSSYFTNGL